jgi:ACS family pantothenate transporter-like MFS transporter
MTSIHLDLDRSNISNAYVSGMKEELNMHGTDFNVSPSSHYKACGLNLEAQKINTIFTCGYIVGMIPS